MVKTNDANFHSISITGYIPVTLWKWQLDQNPISRLPDLCNVRGWHRDIVENDRYWRVVGMQAVGINYYKLSKTCHHAQIDAFLTSWGCAQSKEPIQDHWLVDNSTASAFGAYAFTTKMQAVQVGTMEQSIRRARRQALLWILLYSLHHRIRAIVQPEDSHVLYQRNYCYIASLATYPRINHYVYILYFISLSRLCIYSILLMICTYLIIYNLKKYHYAKI